MDLTRPVLLLAALAILLAPGATFASALKGRTPIAAAKPLPPGQRPAAVATSRADKPLAAATSVGPGQAGYVHYFIVQLPDETLEIQVGIELPDQRIAWSFPGLGVAISPFIEEGVVSAQGKDYEVWHLYGVRPFPDDEAMATFAKALMPRVNAWVKAGTPYCHSDAGRANCMSCIGFVLRVLFPPRVGDYPNLPRDFARASGALPRYTTNDLLLFLTGMLELPGREARLQRLNRLTLPPDLREDLEELIFAQPATETAIAGAQEKRPAARRVGTRSTLRRPL